MGTSVSMDNGVTGKLGQVYCTDLSKMLGLKKKAPKLRENGDTS